MLKYKWYKYNPHIILHPLLSTDGKNVFKRSETSLSGRKIVRMSRHHLNPHYRKDVPSAKKGNFILNLWAHKHFQGWNPLFHFYVPNGHGGKQSYELCIEEIITLMSIYDPLIADKVGTKPWKILFGEKDLDRARALLCRMLAMKFNYQWQEVFPKKITLLRKAA